MKEALKALIHEMEYVLSCINEDKIPFDGDDFHEALRLGKEALSSPNGEAQPEHDPYDEVFIAYGLPQPKQEPVAITITGKLGNIYSFTGDYSLKKGDKVYTNPPQRPWVGLTDNEIDTIENKVYVQTVQKGKPLGLFIKQFAKAIEAKLKEKNYDTR